ncbi:RNA-directed DNA polymerase [Pseudomonas sp. USHLN015]|uniref:RNA-directed DNA polymerase n=1 Tax=Pseudomonas sp. USHLN015 TaxID=3081296 RepID=UPI00301E4809
MEKHFGRAIDDIVEHGDNDTLPFDVDVSFIREARERLIDISRKLSKNLEDNGKDYARKKFGEIQFFSERLLAPAGPAGFRVITKIHPFWNLYFNALGVAIAERHEPLRNDRAHSYRFVPDGAGLFDAAYTWKYFRECTLRDSDEAPNNAVVIQTDVSSFYEHIYHHRVQNFIDELFPDSPTMSVQVDRMLSAFSAGRSFGLPVGGQCSRVLAELLMAQIDRRLNDEGLRWRRYVDDFVIISDDQNSAYRDLAVLSHALADYGLSLNKTKTSFLRVNHYKDYIRAQLGGEDDQSQRLREIDLRFDPYSDTAEEDYEELKGVVQQLDIIRLIDGELEKSQPDNFVVAQISRTLRLLAPEVAMNACVALLAETNLHAFRASFSKIMRGIAALRDDPKYLAVYPQIDASLDSVSRHSLHLLSVDTNCLHYLRALKFKRTDIRARYVASVYAEARTETIKRACIDCWRNWKDRDRFIQVRANWNALGREEQRMMWLAAAEFGDDGVFMRRQVRGGVLNAWALGDSDEFAKAYLRWSEGVV